MNQEEAIAILEKKRAEDASLSTLCLNCGKCCKLAFPQYDYEEIADKSQVGDTTAKGFLSVFKPYDSWQEAQNAVPDHFERIVNELRTRENFDLNKLTFYYCDHLSENHLCNIYCDRPECCKIAPANGWSLFPPGCGYEGWQFEQREKSKKLVRNLKEILEDIALYNDEDVITSDKQTAKELREKITKQIEPFIKYGADNW